MKKGIILLTLIFTIFTSYSQTQIANYLQAGVQDGEALLSAYFEPYAKGFGTSLNGGWVNTAKTHKTFGFDITFTATASIIPNADLTFDINSLNLQKLELADPNNNIAPSIAGDNTLGPELIYTEPNPVTGLPVEIASFDSPKGTGFGYLPLPMVKASFGLPLGIELMGRYAPPVSIMGDYKMSLWGIGVKHDLKQYMPFLKRLPVFNISAMGAYTEYKSTAALNLQPYGHVVVLTSNPFDNQEFGLAAKGLTGNLLISANLPVICFYGGIGFSQTTTALNMTGDYPLSSFDTDPTSQYFGMPVLRDQDIVTDPIDIEVEGNDGIRYMAGIRIKLAVITLHADYTYAEYHVASVGLGFTFR